jgi:hypothetical protein
MSINELDVIGTLNNNTSMLLKPDSWLECQRIQLTEQLQEISKDLQAVHDVQRIKQQLQQTNTAPVRYTDRNTCQTLIKILPLKEAVKVLNNEKEEYRDHQINILASDGYEVNKVK